MEEHKCVAIVEEHGLYITLVYRYDVEDSDAWPSASCAYHETRPLCNVDVAECTHVLVHIAWVNGVEVSVEFCVSVGKRVACISLCKDSHVGWLIGNFAFVLGFLGWWGHCGMVSFVVARFVFMVVFLGSIADSGWRPRFCKGCPGT